MRSIVRNECHEMIEEMLQKFIGQTQSFSVTEQHYNDINICIINIKWNTKIMTKIFIQNL